MNIAGYVQIKDVAQFLGGAAGRFTTGSAGKLTLVRHQINGYCLYTALIAMTHPQHPRPEVK